MILRAYEAAASKTDLEPKEPAPLEPELTIREVEQAVRPEIRCSVCRHKERAVIDGLLVLGIPLRSLGRSYGLSKSAAERHKQNHLPTFPNAQEARQVVDGTIALHVPKLLLRTARFTYDAEVVISRLFRSFMDTLGDGPIDQLRLVMLIALAHLLRSAGSGNSPDKDYKIALQALESWGMNRDAEESRRVD